MAGKREGFFLFSGRETWPSGRWVFFICGIVVERSPRRRVLVRLTAEMTLVWVWLITKMTPVWSLPRKEGKGYHTGAGGRGNGKLRLVHVSLSDRGC